MIDTDRTTENPETEEEADRLAAYFIDPNAAAASRRSLSVIIARRQCYMCQQGFEESEIAALDPQDFIDRIAAHCANEQDFLVPDTPMKESIFRALLANSNEPMDAERISEMLTRKWSMTPFPRDTSPGVIQRLLDDITDYYCVAPAEDS